MGRTPESIPSQCTHLPFLSQGLYSLAMLEQFQEAIIEEDTIEKQLLHPPKQWRSLLLPPLSYRPFLLLLKLLVMLRLFQEKVLSLSSLLPMMLLPRFLPILSMGFWLTKKLSQLSSFAM